MTCRPDQQEDTEHMASVPEQVMRARLADATAEPLLPETFPVPVRYDGRWWHQPADDGETKPVEGAGAEDEPAVAFVLAPPEHAARYEDLRRRRHQAHAAPGERPG